MKPLLFLIIVSSMLYGCEAVTRPGATSVKSTALQMVEEEEEAEAPATDKVIPAELFTQSDAEKILGESCHLTDSSSSSNDGIVRTYKCTFTADNVESSSGKTGNVYFMYEEYSVVDNAKQTYSSIKKSNEKHDGLKTVEGLGDEAYFHSDGQNFHFALVRKANRMIRMKVNKTTAKTSSSGFEEVARAVTARM